MKRVAAFLVRAGLVSTAVAGLVWAGGCSRSAVVHPVKTLGLYTRPAPAYLPVPVAGVAVGHLRDSFGDPRGGGRVHQGIDIFAPRGTPVLAATEGVVLRVGTNNLGGRTVTLLGPGGHNHYYAHLERWAGQREGDWVDAGEVIGYVGNSGNASGGPTHLHYGIYDASGHALNPYLLLTAHPVSVVAGGG
jgi:murein DD-endopeptidase MepM/ murein hydrolase activator NlpD